MLRPRRSSGFGLRLLAIALATLAEAFTLTPAAASMIYCIGSDGHRGFERRSPSAIDCEPCCDDEREPHGERAREAGPRWSGAHGGGERGCVDVVVSSHIHRGADAASFASGRPDPAPTRLLPAAKQPSPSGLRCGGASTICPACVRTRLRTVSLRL